MIKIEFESALEKFDYINKTCWKEKSIIITEFVEKCRNFLVNINDEELRYIYVTKYVIVLLQENIDKLLEMENMFNEIKRDDKASDNEDYTNDSK